MPWIGAIRLPGQQCDQRIGQAAPAEEGHLDAFDIMLVGQHADVGSGLQHARQLHRCIE